MFSVQRLSDSEIQINTMQFGYNAGKITIMSVINILILKCVVDKTLNTCELRKH